MDNPKQYADFSNLHSPKELEKTPAPKVEQYHQKKVILCTRKSLPKGYLFIGRFELKEELQRLGIPYDWAKDSKTGRWLGLLVPNNWRDSLPDYF